ncbi:hypothetical protein F5Y19DRAFT_491373 [Xylariaceae sp. FL1651]|nr:hypothetical protein F5Y19DRAFT_491373 [Xylariaceae sp. FL1651]
MSSSPHQPGPGSGSGTGQRNRRSTSDIPSAIKFGSDSRKWIFGNGNRPWKGRPHGSESRFTPGSKLPNGDANTNNFPGHLPSFIDPVVATDLQQLRKYTQKIKNAAKSVSHVDSAWNDYIKIKEKCLGWCKALMSLSSQRRESSVVSPTTTMSPALEFQKDLALDTLNLIAVDTSSSTQSAGSRVDTPLRHASQEAQCQEAVREWEAAVELLANTLRTSLQETYNEYEKDATLEGFDRICTDKAIRHNTIYRMRNTSISKMMSANLDFFPKYDVRFRNYDEIKKDLAKVRSLLGTSDIPKERTIIERRISPAGDVMLEFANIESEKHPVFRFRVSSHCLRETTSPIFAHMFNSHFLAELDEDTRRSLPSSPTRHICGDGSEVKLYRMPQTELNTERSLEILLHAAHNHNDRVPREVQFSQFVAIAEACLRYRCTSPLELAVEHLWLPFWRGKATDDMLGGVLLICCKLVFFFVAIGITGLRHVFGLCENFTRLSRITILNMTDPNHQQYKSWPQTVQNKISAIRRAKIEQVYDQCRTTLDEYLCPAPRVDPKSSTDRSHPSPTSRLRCPKGDRTCDAQNLGWYMKRLTELGMLPAILPSPALSHIPAPQNRSLLQLINSLCLITSPPQCHGGICDFAPTFRASIKDIYESVSGVTLFDVSGKRGWALSKNRSPRQSQSQSQSNGGAQGGVHEQLFEIAARQRYAPGYFRTEGSGADVDAVDYIHFKILSFLDKPQDLRAAALTNRQFYRSYQRNETRLRGGIRRDSAAAQSDLRLRHVSNGSRPGPSTADAECILYPSASNRLGEERAAMGSIRPQEKFKHGQILLVEDKRLLEGDVNKYARDVRDELIGFTVREGEGPRQGIVQ